MQEVNLQDFLKDSQSQLTFEIKSNTEKSELYSDNYPIRLPLRIRNFETETEFVKFSKNCERLVRSSLEYKEWRNYILDVLKFNECFVTFEKLGEVTLEVHHHIPPLFTLIKSVINKKIFQECEFSTFDICQEVIKVHFDNKIGYLVLISSMHEKLHNGFLDVPISLVKGNYNLYLQEYQNFLENDDLDTINKRLSTKEWKSYWSRDSYPVADKEVTTV